MDGAVLAATRALLVESGFGAVTMAAVAARAGVGKGTLYLRWPDKEALVSAALAEAAGVPVIPDTGSLRGDLVAIVRRELELHRTTDLGPVMRAVVSELAHQPRLRDTYDATLARPWSTAMQRVLARAAARGEVRPGVDHQVFVEALFGPLMIRVMIGHAALDPGVADAVVDLVLDGASPG